MKIGINFHTAYQCISGVEYYCLGLLNAILRTDKNNEYIVYTNHPDLINNYVEQRPNLFVYEIRHLKTRIARILWEHTILPQLAQKHSLDILHCPSYICPLYKINIPYVLTIHDTIAIDYPGWCRPTNALYYNCLMKHSTKQAAKIISVSERTADDLKRNFNLPCSKIEIVHSGIDKIFSVKKESFRLNQIREKYSLPERYILFVGNIEPKKNLSTILNLQKILKKKGFPQKLVIVGKKAWGTKKEFAEINKEIKSKDVVYTGYISRDELPCIYQMADVFVFPSLYEGFGFPPLEAMASGTPVISTKNGTVNESIAQAAIIVEPFNLEQIAQAVISITTNDELRENHIKMGLQRSSLFNWDISAEKTIQVYENVVKK